jgi:hypothetical protein
MFYSDSGDTEIEGSGIFLEAVTDATFSEEEGLYDVLVHYTIEEQDILSGKLSKVTSFKLQVAHYTLHIAHCTLHIAHCTLQLSPKQVLLTLSPDLVQE